MNDYMKLSNILNWSNAIHKHRICYGYYPVLISIPTLRNNWKKKEYFAAPAKSVKFAPWCIFKSANHLLLPMVLPGMWNVMLPATASMSYISWNVISVIRLQSWGKQTICETEPTTTEADAEMVSHQIFLIIMSIHVPKHKDSLCKSLFFVCTLWWHVVTTTNSLISRGDCI